MNHSISIGVDCANFTKSMAAPNALHWLWKPWYAKLWWICAGAFWGCMATEFWLGLHQFDALGPYLKYLALLLHPELALPVIGFGYIRAWLEYRATQVAKDEHEGDGPLTSTLAESWEPLNFCADASDPRSPLNSLNPINGDRSDFHPNAF